jgi:vacuolar-type H+-ATPase subunit H
MLSASLLAFFSTTIFNDLLEKYGRFPSDKITEMSKLTASAYTETIDDTDSFYNNLITEYGAEILNEAKEIYEVTDQQIQTFTTKKLTELVVSRIIVKAVFDKSVDYMFEKLEMDELSDADTDTDE